MTQITKENIAAVLCFNGYTNSYIAEYNELRIFNDNYYLGSVVIGNVNNWLNAIEAIINKKLEPLLEANPFDVVKVGDWVRCKCLADEATVGAWYQRQKCGVLFKFVYICNTGGIRGTNQSEDWDLTDIRDYNPDEEIVMAVGDEVEVDDFGNTLILSRFDYINEEIIYHFGGSTLGQKFEFVQEGTKSVNGKRGKFVIPPFDFEKTLLDAGFKETDSYIYYAADGLMHSGSYFNKESSTFNGERRIARTPANAKILIDTARILYNLEQA